MTNDEWTTCVKALVVARERWIELAREAAPPMEATPFVEATPKMTRTHAVYSSPRTSRDLKEYERRERACYPPSYFSDPDDRDTNDCSLEQFC